MNVALHGLWAETASLGIAKKKKLKKHVKNILICSTATALGATQAPRTTYGGSLRDPWAGFPREPSRPVLVQLGRACVCCYDSGGYQMYQMGNLCRRMPRIFGMSKNF